MPGDILAAVIQYLDTRPHGEVRQLVDAISNRCEVYAEPKKTDEFKPVDESGNPVTTP